MIERTLLETRLLMQLVTVADTGGLSRAAKFLGLSQPALSKAVRNAETRLGTSIFRRTRGGVRPTDVGDSILVRARQALLTIAGIEAEARSWAANEVGPIRIGCGPTIVNQLITMVLVEFMVEYPKLELELVSGNPHDLAQSVEAGDLDFMVGFSENVNGSDLLTQRPIRRDRLSFFASTTHPLAMKDTISPSELAPHLIGLPFRTSKIDNWLDARAKENAQAPYRVMLCNDVSALSDLVESGLVVSIGPLPYISQLAERSNLIPITVEGFEFDRLLHCVIPRERPSPIVAERLIALIEARMSNISPVSRTDICGSENSQA